MWVEGTTCLNDKASDKQAEELSQNTKALTAQVEEMKKNNWDTRESIIGEETTICWIRYTGAHKKTTFFWYKIC